MANAKARLSTCSSSPRSAEAAGSRNGRTMRIKSLPESAALRRLAAVAAVSSLVVGLAGCETAPPPQPEPPPVAYAGPPPNTTVYAYPEHGQSADQQSR